jgi:hypothetical protein
VECGNEERGKWKNACLVCNPSLLCSHGNLKRNCKVCKLRDK